LHLYGDLESRILFSGFVTQHDTGFPNTCIYPTRCNVTQFILFGNCSIYFGWYHHPSSGAHTTVSTASVICHTVTATCRYRGRVVTGLSVLWVAYATQTSFPKGARNFSSLHRALTSLLNGFCCYLPTVNSRCLKLTFHLILVPTL
jgi:hypothetical protein